MNRYLFNQDFQDFIQALNTCEVDYVLVGSGVEFDTAFEQAEWFNINDALAIRTLRLSDLLAAKKAAGRSKDLDDFENLT